METGHPTRDGYARLLRSTGAFLGRVMVAALVALLVAPSAGAIADEPPEVIVPPMEQTVTAGQPAVFEAYARGEPTPTIQWEVSTNGGAKFTEDKTDPGNTTNRLRVENTSFAESGWQYRAFFHNSAGKQWSTAARLTVNVGLVITTAPVSQTVSVGEPATFTAAASGIPTPSVQWEVSTNGGNTFTNDTTDSGNTTGNLTVERTTAAENGYKYRAVFENVADTATSTSATLTVSAPVPPAASFAWFPPAPFVGEPVSFASNSTDAASPLTAFAWDLAGDGPLIGGGPVLSTWFSSPGAHVVRLRVTDAKGLSSVTAETIPVTLAPPILLQPFPVVRLVGLDTSSGVQLIVFTVLAPVTARITVTCRGRGCPTKFEDRLAASRRHKRKSGSLLIAFPRFERSLEAGITLEVRVSKADRIGKYTKFVIRRGKLPTRVDKCLNPANSQPMACPSS
jgi:hypothetical protein